MFARANKTTKALADRTFPGETRSRVKVLRDGEAAETKAAAKQRGHRQRDRASFVVQALVEEKERFRYWMKPNKGNSKINRN